MKLIVTSISRFRLGNRFRNTVDTVLNDQVVCTFIDKLLYFLFIRLFFLMHLQIVYFKIYIYFSIKFSFFFNLFSHSFNFSFTFVIFFSGCFALNCCSEADGNMDHDSWVTLKTYEEFLGLKDSIEALTKNYGEILLLL